MERHAPLDHGDRTRVAVPGVALAPHLMPAGGGGRQRAPSDMPPRALAAARVRASVRARSNRSALASGIAALPAPASAVAGAAFRFTAPRAVYP